MTDPARAHAYENPRPEVAALVPAGARRILDLGCASGALGAALKARQGAEVVGVERDPGYAAAARARLDRVIEADLDAFEEVEPLGAFDCLIAADVLEHLVDPWAVLARFTRALAPGGHVVVSLPNVRHWETFWALGRHGTWPRRPTGIFDATHLRWFTLLDAHALLGSAGLEAEALRRQVRFAPNGTRFDARLGPVAGAVPGLRALVTFQHVLRARRP